MSEKRPLQFCIMLEKSNIKSRQEFIAISVIIFDLNVLAWEFLFFKVTQNVDEFI